MTDHSSGTESTGSGDDGEIVLLDNTNDLPSGSKTFGAASNPPLPPQLRRARTRSMSLETDRGQIIYTQGERRSFHPATNTRSKEVQKTFSSQTWEDAIGKLKEQVRSYEKYMRPQCKEGGGTVSSDKARYLHFKRMVNIIPFALDELSRSVHSWFYDILPSWQYWPVLAQFLNACDAVLASTGKYGYDSPFPPLRLDRIVESLLVTAFNRLTRGLGLLYADIDIIRSSMSMDSLSLLAKSAQLILGIAVTYTVAIGKVVSLPDASPPLSLHASMRTMPLRSSRSSINSPMIGRRGTKQKTGDKLGAFDSSSIHTTVSMRGRVVTDAGMGSGAFPSTDAQKLAEVLSHNRSFSSRGCVYSGERSRATEIFRKDELALLRLLPEEKIYFQTNDSQVWLQEQGDVLVGGTLYITNYQLIFLGIDMHTQFHVPIHSIVSVDKVGGRKKMEQKALVLRSGVFDLTSYRLDISTADFELIRLILPYKAGSKTILRRQVCDLIRQLLKQSVEQYYAFYLAHPLSETQPGWDIYNPEAEFGRMSIPDSSWRLSWANQNYEICDTYPSLFSVPTDFSDDNLAIACEYRSKNRFPSLSWRHANGASLTRSSQPRSGMARRSCFEDELFVNSILKAGKGKDTYERAFHIMDARPRANAMANTAKGAGFEIMKNYKGCHLQFLGIPNIHVMRDARNQLFQAVHRPSSDRMLSAIDSSNWLQYSALLLQKSVDICGRLCSGDSVLVHCSDGWDRTAQLVSLVELMLDPYFRTRRGLIILIEKEWLSMGHQFALRSGADGGVGPDEQRSPIFLQFLDALWQITRQFPAAFEFNAQFLVTLFKESVSCHYGTFLYNSQRERKEARLSQLSLSVWPVLLEDPKLVNPLYDPSFTKPLLPETNVCDMMLWLSLYAPHKPHVPGVVERLLQEEIERKDEQIAALEAKVAALEAKQVSMQVESEGSSLSL